MTRFLTDWQQRSTVLAAAQKAAFKPAVWLIVPIFILLFIAGQIASLIFILPVMLFPHLFDATAGTDIDALINSNLWISLYATIPITIVFILYLKFGERRSFASMGFVRGGVVRRYLKGLGWGLALGLLALGIACAVGGLRFGGIAEQIPWAMLLLYFVGFLFQGMSEEVICRSWMMVSAANKAPLWLGIALNSVVFAVLHMLNAGINVFSLLNLILFGLFASFYFLRTDNVWGIGALHAAWNFTIGCLLGIEVSGNAIKESVLHFTATDAPSMISGGRFGIEGSIATTLAYLIGMLVLIFWPRRAKTDTQTTA